MPAALEIFYPKKVAKFRKCGLLFARILEKGLKLPCSKEQNFSAITVIPLFINFRAGIFLFPWGIGNSFRPSFFSHRPNIVVGLTQEFCRDLAT
jgi:hypothetical protein